MSAATDTELRPFYFIVVFWGEKYRRFFETLCLPSLLAPGNVPALAARPGSKILISTSQADWAALQELPLFRRLRDFIEPVLIDIGMPGPDDLVQLHMSKGHKRSSQAGFEAKANCVFLAPDLVLSDGMVNTLIRHRRAGHKAVLAVALRFDMDKCVEGFRAHGLVAPDQPLVLPPRLAAEIGCGALHSEFHRFDWDAVHFVHYPIVILVQVPGGGILAHSASWAIVMANFGEIGALHVGSLENNTIDRQFMFENLDGLRGTDAMAMISDSDELLYLSMTSERDLTFYPLQPVPENLVPGVARGLKIASAQKLLFSDYMDPFMRWMFSIPCRVHPGELGPEWRDAERRMRRVADAALRHPDLRDRLLLWGCRRADAALGRPVGTAIRVLRYLDPGARSYQLQRVRRYLDRLSTGWSHPLSRLARRVTASDRFQQVMVRHPQVKKMLRGMSKLLRLRLSGGL